MKIVFFHQIITAAGAVDTPAAIKLSRILPCFIIITLFNSVNVVCANALIMIKRRAIK